MTLEEELQKLIVEALQLDDVTPESIDLDGELFGSGLGLDSIDVLELATALERRYGVKLTQETPEVRAAFRSVNTLATFVRTHQKP